MAWSQWSSWKAWAFLSLHWMRSWQEAPEVRRYFSNFETHLRTGSSACFAGVLWWLQMHFLLRIEEPRREHRQEDEYIKGQGFVYCLEVDRWPKKSLRKKYVLYILFLVVMVQFLALVKSIQSIFSSWFYPFGSNDALKQPTWTMYFFTEPIWPVVKSSWVLKHVHRRSHVMSPSMWTCEASVAVLWVNL